MKHVCDAGAEKCVVKVLKDKLKYANCVLLRGCVKMLYSLVQAKQVSFLYCGEVCNMTEVCAEKNCQESVWCGGIRRERLFISAKLSMKPTEL